MISKRTIILGVITALMITVLLSITCRPTPYGMSQGYEQNYGGQAAPVYYQPDHSFLTTWMMYHILFQQPSYHVYMPPAGYPPSYRPWQPAPQGFRPQAAAPGRPDSRTQGGFTPATGAAKPAADSRAQGGFAPKAAPPAPPPSRPASPSSMSPRSTGGFSGSSSRPSSSPRSSGGFGGKR